jgi:hypothetical protein
MKTLSALFEVMTQRPASGKTPRTRIHATTLHQADPRRRHVKAAFT